VRFPTRVQQVDKLQARKAQVKDEERHRRHSRVLSGDTTETLLLREDADAASSDEGKFGFEPGPPFTLVSFEKYAHQFKEEYFGVKECNDIFSDPVTRQKPSIESIEGEYWRIVEHPTEQLEVISL
jgi:histone demethylase JARID1